MAKKIPAWLAIVLGLLAAFVVAILIGGFFVYRWVNEPGRLEALSAMAQAADRPGSAEMRALGCDHGMIIKATEIAAMTSAETESELPTEVLITCRLEPKTKEVPRCEDVARGYASGAQDAPEAFHVQVHRQTLSKPEVLCEGIYSPDGKLVEESRWAKGE